MVPARNEADVVAAALTSLLAQDYPGSFQVILIDDHSDDATASIAEELASKNSSRLKVCRASPLPAGWTGKLWALSEGKQTIDDGLAKPDYLWLVDADIEHQASMLRCLVSLAEADNRDLVSVMVLLSCKRFWERLLVPPFVFFFQKLYPFPWVNQPSRRQAAAAGGCLLVRWTSLADSGGFAGSRAALIDDCSLARQVKTWRQTAQDGGGGLWLGLSRLARSLRPYDGLRGIWHMVARSAYTQLRHSPWLLLGTLIGMIITYVVPPALVILWPWHGDPWLALLGLAAWALMSVAYGPTLRYYGQPAIMAPLLPAAAFLYAAMTLDSALQHWRGRGGRWKGRRQATRQVALGPSDPSVAAPNSIVRTGDLARE